MTTCQITSNVPNGGLIPNIERNCYCSARIENKITMHVFIVYKTLFQCAAGRSPLCEFGCREISLCEHIFWLNVQQVTRYAHSSPQSHRHFDLYVERRCDVMLVQIAMFFFSALKFFIFERKNQSHSWRARCRVHYTYTI